MSSIRYYSEVIWSKLPLADFRARFFVEAYVEKLRMQTPHFYQARLLNAFSASEELLSLAREYQETDRNRTTLISSLDELIECWEADPVIQELMGEFTIARIDLCKRVKGGDLSSKSIVEITTLCKALLCRQSTYTTVLLERLEEAVTGPTDLNQIERITSTIDKLTGLYTTHLLNQGYSPTYLYNRKDLLIRDNNYAGRNFSDQFKYFLTRLNTQQSNFDVYFGIHSTKPSVILAANTSTTLSILDDAPNEINGQNLEKLKKGTEVNLYIKNSLTSTDYVTAALKTKESIDKLLDIVSAFEFGNEIHVSSTCTIINRGQLTHTESLNVDVLLAFISSEKGTATSQSSTYVHHILQNIDEQGREQLGRSLRYLRLAKISASLEQKLLNLWIALESLFPSQDTSIIGNILDFVPCFYSIIGISRRVGYLRDLLSSNSIVVTPLISEGIFPNAPIFDETLSNNQVFHILRNEQAAIELFSSLGAKEHLKYKILQVFNELKNNKRIQERVTRSEADVTRQLRRIYSLRNKIAHTGHFHGVRPQLVTHLLDYVSISYRAIGTAAGNAASGHKYQISELLAASKLGAKIIHDRIGSKEEVSSLERITLSAVI